MLATWGRMALAALVVALGVAGAPAVVVPAQAAITNGVISGTLTGLGGTPVASVDVRLHKRTSGVWSEAALTTSDFDGKYRFPSLTNGTYRVCFSRWGYEDGCWFGAATLATASNIVVNDWTPKPVANAMLTAAAPITGTVTVEGSTPDDVSIAAYEWNADRQEYDWVNSTSTRRDGTYSLHVGAGTYRLFFEDEWNSRFAARAYPAAATIEDGQDVTVTSPGRSGVDIVLGDGPSLTGKVTLRGLGVADASVRVYPLTATGAVSEHSYVGVDTGPTGSFAVRVFPGTYVVEAHSFEANAYGIWGDVDDLEAGRRAVAHPGLYLSGIDIELDGPDPGWTQPTPVVTPPVETPPVTPTPVTPTPNPTPTPAASSVVAVTSTKVAGKARVGRTLRLSRGSYAPTTAKVAVQWFVGKRAIKKATKNKFKVTRTMRGKKIKVRITVSSPGLATYTTTIKVGKVTR